MSDRPRAELLASDRHLIEKILSDPDEGWKDFLSTYEGFLNRIIGRYDLPKEDHQDVFQEVSHILIKDDFKVLRAWDSKRSLLQNYLTVVASHAVITFFRSRYHAYDKRKVDYSTTDDEEALPIAEHQGLTYSPPERLQRIQVLEIFKGNLDRWVEEEKLKPKDRLLVEMRLLGLSYKEISKSLGIPVSHATGRFTRLKPLLKSGLEQSGVEPSDFLDLSTT